jgi:O-antigen ligase
LAGAYLLSAILALVAGLLARPDLFLDNGRVEIWRTAWRMFAASPIVGQGPNSFKGWWLAGGPRLYSFGHAHNLPLDLAAQTGLLGLGTAAWLGWRVLQALRRAGGVWAAAALASTIALLVHSLADVPTTQPYVTIAWLALVQLGLAPAADDRA